MKEMKMLLLGVVSLSAPVLFVRQAVKYSEEKSKSENLRIMLGKDSLEIVQLKRDIDTLKKAKNINPTIVSKPTIIKIPPINVNVSNPTGAKPDKGTYNQTPISDDEGFRRLDLLHRALKRFVEDTLKVSKNDTSGKIQQKNRMRYFFYSQQFQPLHEYLNSSDLQLRPIALKIQRLLEEAAIEINNEY